MPIQLEMVQYNAMNVVYDENIPFGREAFATLGSVQSCAGRAITPKILAGCDALFVRSVTPVNAALLDDSNVRFVATATSGSDHIDTAYLHRRGIAWIDAIGSNARSVAEYVLTGVLELAARDGIALRGKHIGVVGVGHVGSLVAAYAQALGMTVVLNDPPRQRRERDFSGVDLATALAADIVTLHTPLTTEGPDATFHLLDSTRIAALKPGAMLVHTCRGPVVDTHALKARLSTRRDLRVIMDVWEDEPAIDPEFLALVDIGTPHIAGYSWPSKVRATDIVYRAACRFFDCAPAWRPPALPAGVAALHINGDVLDPTSATALLTALRPVYDIVADDTRLRRLLSMPRAEHGPYFDLLRKTYPIRLEWPLAHVQAASTATRALLVQLGFTC